MYHAIAWAQAGGGPAALAQLDSGLGLFHRLARTDPRNARLLDEYAVALAAGARLHVSAGRTARSEALLREALRVRQDVAAFSAGFAQNERALAEVEGLLGELEAERAMTGRAGVPAARKRALELLERSLARFSELRAKGPLPAEAAEIEKRAAAALKRLGGA